jgi:hypothetical protein
MNLYLHNKKLYKDLYNLVGGKKITNKNKKSIKLLYTKDEMKLIWDLLGDIINKLGNNTAKYILSIQKELNKFGIKILLDKDTTIGWHCGSGSTLFDLEEEHNIKNDEPILYTCKQHFLRNFFNGKYKNNEIQLYHTLFGKNKKMNDLRKNIINTLKKNKIKYYWNKPEKEAITIYIPNNISKKDYDIFKKVIDKNLKKYKNN